MFARLTIACALAAVACAFTPSAALAVSPGSGRWYWPVGTENFQGWDGYWVYRASNHSWHMAQDMPAPVGHDVYAVGDGTILESGADHGYGGVLVVLHKTAEGRYFKAVYGHIWRGSHTAVGDKVTAGQVIGRVNECRHVHFGIHPGRAYPPDNNPYRGHTYVKSKTYGWVDPVKYLRANPRILDYAAPALPVVASVETMDTATVLGVADGEVYWTIGADDAKATFARSLADDGETRELGADSALPSLDATRFVPAVAANSFTLADRLPLLTLKASSSSPLWGHAVTFSGTLKNAVGAVFVGATLVLETSPDGLSWSKVGSAKTGLAGAYSVGYVPAKRISVRVRFVAPETYLPAESRPTTVAPRPAIAAPVVPSTVREERRFTVVGTVTPHHTAGPSPIMLHVQRRVSGTWRDYPLVTTTYRDSGSASLYRGSPTLPEGTWRIRAEAPRDDLHAGKNSAWTGFKVR